MSIVLAHESYLSRVRTIDFVLSDKSSPIFTLDEETILRERRKKLVTDYIATCRGFGCAPLTTEYPLPQVPVYSLLMQHVRYDTEE